MKGPFLRFPGLAGASKFGSRRRLSWVLAGLLLLFAPRARALSPAEADAAFDSFNTAFYVVSSGRGYYKADTGGGRADFWKQAEMIEMIIDAYERTNRATYKTMITQSIDGFLYYQGSDWLWNQYNDDIMWMVIACCRGYLATGNTTYRDRAKYHFDAVYARGWDNALGGGIWWTTDKDGKNACVNGPAAIAACLLHEIYGDSAYLQKAQALFAWERAVLYDPGTGKVYDNINASGVVNSNWIFTYNQGTFIGAANSLYNLTGASNYLTDALTAALYTRNAMGTADILPEYGDTGDGGGFTGILARWLGRFVRDQNLWGTFYDWMAQNAHAAWAVRRPDNLSWCKWRTQTPAGTLYSWGCSSSVMMLQVVPADYGLPGLIYEPVSLTSNSYNRDVIVERTAPPPPTAGAYTTASMDGGTANTEKSWYEIGYNRNAGALHTGLPAAGSTFASASFSDHAFRMAPSYSANNAVLLNSIVTTGTLTLSHPAAYSRLSFLVSAGKGAGGVQARVYHQDGTVQTNTLAIPDWFNGSSPAYTAKGRLDVRTFAFDSVNSSNPRLYSVDVVLVNTTSPVTRVVFNYASGANNCIFAISGSTGGAFTPIGVTGYNQDLIVEAGAPTFAPLPGYTSATMEGGVANNGNTWYEAGYLPFATNTGLPLAGSAFTNGFYPAHRYRLASSYSANNAVFLSAAVPNASLVPAAPAAFSSLSFLTAAGRGPVAVGCLIRHADGTAQNRSFVAPDWFGQAPVAAVANGRVNVSSGVYDSLFGNNPRLYSAAVTVSNTSSPVTNILLTFSGAGDATAAILAVSAIPGSVPPVWVGQPLSQKSWEGSTVGFQAAAVAVPSPSFQWQRGANGIFTNLVDGPGVSGSTSSNLWLGNVTPLDTADYRLVATNAAGSSTSAVATLAVLSAWPDVTQPGDPIISFGGSSPAGEEVAHAIDNNTAKYLNFGLNNGSGSFQGPVGFVVTPAFGPSLVRHLRFYTGNDFPGRDPAHYSLFGSNDGGTTYTLISSGLLTLPEGRNPGGLPLDPIRRHVQQVSFANDRTFTTYRLSFNTIKTNSASMMQIGEVELLGVRVPELRVGPGAEPGTMVLVPNTPGRLWSTPALQNPQTVWLDEGPIAGPVVVPISPALPARFYRLSVP